VITVNTESLGETLDAVNDALFYGRHLTERNRTELAGWIAQRRGRPGSDAGMFAPTDEDLCHGVRVYTGELVKSGAAIRHVLGEEECPGLILLDVRDNTIREALEQADGGMLCRLRQTETSGNVHGMYCCEICSVAYWPNVMVEGLDRNEERLTAGMVALRAHRTNSGRWRRSRCYYTLLTLSEINLRLALDEMRCAAPLLERYVKKKVADSRLSERRHIVC